MSTGTGRIFTPVVARLTPLANMTMSVSPDFSAALLQWLDLYEWSHAVAYVASCVAVRPDLVEAWDDLRWDLAHDRKVLRTHLETWGVDEDVQSPGRVAIAHHRAQFRFDLREDSPASEEAEKVAGVALEWLRGKRADQEAVVRAALLGEPQAVRQHFATTWSEFCSTHDATPPAA